MERIDPIGLNREVYEKDSNRNVFVMMRYVNGSVLDDIEATIKKTLSDFDLNAILAKDVVLDSMLWSNIKFCMDHSRYGIVVFDRVRQPDFSPNVTLELGYMLALKRPSLILKESSIPTLNTDIINHLFTSFDPYDVQRSVSLAIEDWLAKLGHSKIKQAEIISAETAIKANKKRTTAIIRSLEAQTNNTNSHIIRQAASMSSVAISENESYRGDEDKELLRLLLQEKELICGLLDKGTVLRLIISPETQIERVELGLVSAISIKNNIVPRYDTLIDFIDRHLDDENFQVTYTLRLPHDNLTIVDTRTVFIGRKRRREIGFPFTTQIFDPAVIAEDIQEFDNIFIDNVGVLLGINTIDDNVLGSRRLKRKVIDKLMSCKKRLEDLSAKVNRRT